VSIPDCWHVRTNTCARINICAKSFFVLSLKSRNIFWRNLTDFTALLWNKSVAAKRCDLMGRTGRGKSVSVALRKTGPKNLEKTVPGILMSRFLEEFEVHIVNTGVFPINSQGRMAGLFQQRWPTCSRPTLPKSHNGWEPPQNCRVRRKDRNPISRKANSCQPYQ